MVQRTEPQIVDAVMRGDQVALGKLLRLYRDPIYNVCLRMVSHPDDAAELAQDTMLKVIEHVREFNGRSDISTWIIRIAMNLCISHLRKRKLRQAASLENPGRRNGSGDDQLSTLRQELADTRELSPESGVQQREMIAYLHSALDRLEEDFRAVLVLRDIQEMDYQQMAEVLALPVGTVKSRLFRARLALRHEMLKLCPPGTPGGTVAPGSPGSPGSPTPRPASPRSGHPEGGGP